MRHCVIGYKGEVGSAVYHYLEEREDKVYGLEPKSRLPDFVDYIHVCIPYSNKFISIVRKYAKTIDHKCIIIYSTVPPGTTQKLGRKAVHSPIEGRHPELYNSFVTFERMVAGEKAGEVAEFYNKTGLKTRWFSNAKTTELGKILSTTRYGLNLLFADEQLKMCKKYKVNYHDTVMEYVRMYNQGYLSLGCSRFVQQLLAPPNGKIGGHCVVPNAKLLFKDTKNPIVGRIAKYG